MTPVVYMMGKKSNKSSSVAKNSSGAENSSKRLKRLPGLVEVVGEWCA
jgi:hypothetical protein